MPLKLAGQVKLCLHSDMAVFGVGGDIYTVPIDALSQVMAGGLAQAPVYRRYASKCASCVYEDVQIAALVLRSKRRQAVILTFGPYRSYAVPGEAMRRVLDGVEESAPVSLVIADASQLDDAHSRQTTLEAGA